MSIVVTSQKATQERQEHPLIEKKRKMMICNEREIRECGCKTESISGLRDADSSGRTSRAGGLHSVSV